MNQQRLDIHARKVSVSDLDHQQKVDKLEAEIKEQRKLIEVTKERLETSRQRQQENGLRSAEIPVTDSLIQSKLTPLRKHLKLLESKYEKIIKQKPDIQAEASRQSDMFLR